MSLEVLLGASETTAAALYLLESRIFVIFKLLRRSFLWMLAHEVHHHPEFRLERHLAASGFAILPKVPVVLVRVAVALILMPVFVPRICVRLLWPASL